MIKLFNNFLFEMSNYGDDITGIKNIIIVLKPKIVQKNLTLSGVVECMEYLKKGNVYMWVNQVP